MKQIWSLLSMVLLLTACQSKKELPNKQELFRKEIHAIDWTKVDEYPSYNRCDSLKDKEEAYACFYTQLTEEIQQQIQNYPQFSSYKPNDSIVLNIKIAPSQYPKIQLAKNSTFVLDSPVADSLFSEIAKNLSPIMPATKRGIPVQSELTVKIKLNKK